MTKKKTPKSKTSDKKSSADEKTTIEKKLELEKKLEAEVATEAKAKEERAEEAHGEVTPQKPDSTGPRFDTPAPPPSRAPDN